MTSFEIGINLAASILGIIFSIGSLILAIYVVIELNSFKRSTHRIEYTTPERMTELKSKAKENIHRLSSKLDEDLGYNSIQDNEDID